MANETIQADGIRALLDAGVVIGAKVITEHMGRPVALVPERYKIEVLPMPPTYVPRGVNFTDVESFATYVNRFKTDGTLLFATLTDTDCRIVAHLDYWNHTSLPGGIRGDTVWSSHTATLVCVQTKEWKTWMENNGGPDGAFTQVEFAQFLEDNERVFRSPDATSLIEMVTNLEGKNNMRCNSAVRMANGRIKVDYEEDVQLTGGVGTASVELPDTLICGIIPFENGPEPYEVRSRLRYRIGNRQIVFWYETIAPHLVLRDAARSVMDRVREKVSAPLLIGG